MSESGISNPGQGVSPRIVQVQAVARGNLRTVDDSFEELARVVPGFGGLFYDTTGRLNVYLTDPGVRAEVTPALATFLTQRKPDLLPAKQLEVEGMKVLIGQFDYLQLRSWYRRLPPIFGKTGVILADIDEAQNRIVLGVEKESHRAVVANELATLGVPQGMVLIEQMPPVEFISGASRAGAMPPSGDLHSAVRGVPASVAIEFPTTNGVFNCTIGWNAKFRNENGYDGVQYFVTASHCSQGTWTNDGTPFGQPTINYHIGDELIDPESFTTAEDPYCPTGFNCRYSDALLAKYAPGVTWKYGLFPTVQADYPFPITGYKQFTGGDGQPTQMPDDFYVGLSVQKTGATTGKTNGNISRTCVAIHANYQLIYTPHWFLCQFQATGLEVDYGDSGSPVYHVNAGGDGDPLMGIAWGIQYDNNVDGAALRTTFSHYWYASVELANAMGGGVLQAGYNECVYGSWPMYACYY